MSVKRKRARRIPTVVQNAGKALRIAIAKHRRGTPAKRRSYHHLEERPSGQDSGKQDSSSAVLIAASPEHEPEEQTAWRERWRRASNL